MSILILLLPELIIYIPLLLFFKTDIGIVEVPLIQLTLSLVCRTLTFLIYIYLSKTKSHLFKQRGYIKKNSPIAFISFQALALCIILINSLFMSSKQSHIFLYQVIIIVTGLVFIVINFLDYLEREKSLREQHQLESQRVYVKNLEEFVSTLRKEKHDIANHLSTINVLCKLNTPDLVERIDTYLSNLTAQFQSSYRSFSTGNDYINALLALKSTFAEENNIDFSVDFKAPIYELNLPDSELISIFGNIIDNAFEALLKDSCSSKLVNISTYIEQGKYYINISNNGPQIHENMAPKIFERGFSTKEEKKDHGYGLYITKQTVLRNKGTIKVISNTEETAFQIVFELGSYSEELTLSREFIGA
jgi:two-component system, LytTR family, sensor histidine kinase AgrC